MALLVLKFGGTSVADIARIRNVAAHVKREADAGHFCAVVVSAMAGATNQLVTLVEQAWGFKERMLEGALLAGLADPAQHRRRPSCSAHHRPCRGRAEGAHD